MVFFVKRCVLFFQGGNGRVGGTISFGRSFVVVQRSALRALAQDLTAAILAQVLKALRWNADKIAHPSITPLHHPKILWRWGRAKHGSLHACVPVKASA